MVVVPAAIPVTVPEAFTVPDVTLVLLHAPPPVTSVSTVIAPPAHTTTIPVIAAGFMGNGFTVTTVVAARLPQLFV